MEYLLIILGFLLLVSCENMIPPAKEIVEVVAWDGMGKAIEEGDTLQFLITEEYRRNDVVGFF
ncbi:MAG: hypothetical protein AB8H47_01300 [Bacteroidia bacterium]